MATTTPECEHAWVCPCGYKVRCIKCGAPHPVHPIAPPPEEESAE